jgi:hypothetical protein
MLDDDDVLEIIQKLIIFRFRSSVGVFDVTTPTEEFSSSSPFTEYFYETTQLF